MSKPSNSIYQLVDDDITALNSNIIQQLKSHVPLIETIGHYIVDAGGKRLRPLLVLLSAHACNYKGNQHIQLATIIEFIHTATLLHDDVVDTSDLRRGRLTVNAKWGNAPSVLVGDFLYSRAFQIMVDLNNMSIMQILSNTTNTIAEGEVLQLINSKNPDTTIYDYYDVIRYKTAILFAASARTAAILAEADDDTQNALHAYGLHLGLAFQLIDDLLDYSGDTDTLGKNIGDDLADGKPTLPLIYALAHGNTEEKNIISHAIKTADVSSLPQVLTAVKNCGALDYTKEKAYAEAAIARSCLEQLNASNFKDKMLLLTELAVDRES